MNLIYGRSILAFCAVLMAAVLILTPSSISLSVKKLDGKTETILNFVKQFLPENPIILEAGAFEGTDTLKLSEKWPNSTIYSFEPVPQLFYYVQERIKNIKNVLLNNIALSDNKGIAEFHVSEIAGRPGISYGSGSLLAPKDTLKYDPNIVFNHKIAVKTTTIDEWAQENKIDHIDFFWLDMQGVELNALMKATNILKTVKVIYTEVEFLQAYEGQYLYIDVMKWLYEQGFREVARDFDYPPTWYYGNSVFVRR